MSRLSAALIGPAERSRFADCATRRFERRFASARRVEPGAVHAGDGAAIIGDCPDHGGPGLRARTSGVLGAVVAIWVKAQAVGQA